VNDTATALAVIEPSNVAIYFKPQGLDPILEKIRDEAKSTLLDISTADGRKRIASLAYKVARTKTALDELGKKLTEDQKKQIKAVDAERARAWDALDALQKEIRAPLTEWEEKEKKRIADHEAALAAIAECPNHGQPETASALSQRLESLENRPPRDWQEFSSRAAKVLADEIERTKALLALAQKREAEQAELARLQKEEADRKQRERDERLKAEAAEKARLETERKAKEQADALAAQVKAEADAAAAREAEIQRKKDEAEARAKKAEEDRVAAVAKAEADRKAAEKKAEADRLAAAEQAKRDADAAARREREKIEAEKKAEADAAAAREADKKHRAKINNEILAALLARSAVGFTEAMAKKVIEAVAKGEIPHVKISY